jgi:uncharacterized protein YuzE
METLKFDQGNALQSSYDAEGDVLYISFGKPQRALSIDTGNVLLNYREDDGLLVGITIMNARRMLEEKPVRRRAAKPPRERKPRKSVAN